MSNNHCSDDFNDDNFNDDDFSDDGFTWSSSGSPGPLCQRCNKKEAISLEMDETWSCFNCGLAVCYNCSQVCCQNPVTGEDIEEDDKQLICDRCVELLDVDTALECSKKLIKIRQVCEERIKKAKEDYRELRRKFKKMQQEVLKNWAEATKADLAERAKTSEEPKQDNAD